MVIIDKKNLLRIDAAVQQALEVARHKRNEEDRRYIVSSIGQDLAMILTPLLDKIADNSRMNREDMKDIIREIKVEAPIVNVAPPKIEVQTPKAEVKVEIPTLKIPEVKVKVSAPQVTVKPADLKMPKEMQVKGMDKLLEKITEALNRKVEFDVGNKPLNVILTDEKGQVYRALTKMVTGGSGGGGVVTTRKIEDIPQGFEQLAVLTTATKLASIPDKATKAIMTVEDATLRFRDDGTDPTSTVGLRVFIAGTIILNSRQALTNFRAIRTGSTNSELNVNYYESK